MAASLRVVGRAAVTPPLPLDYDFTVYTNNLEPYGPVQKQNMDVVKLTFDCTPYLNTNEVLSALTFPTSIIIDPAVAATGGWLTDYRPAPCPETTMTSPTDTYPLRVLESGLVNSGTAVMVMVAAGTPLLSYLVSFVITGTADAGGQSRRKELDLVITIDEPPNPGMVGPGPLPTPTATLIVINGSTTLPLGFGGYVFLENSGSVSNIIITLPPNPSPGQVVDFIDTLGTDAGLPVTFNAPGGAAVDADGVTTFVSSINWDCLRFVWTGTPGWHIEYLRFGSLA